MNRLGPYTAGEIPEPLTYQFLNADGQPLDLTGYTATLVIRRNDVTTDHPATVTDPEQGAVTYTWVDSDLDQPGELQAQFWVHNGTNRYASVKLTAAVRPGIGPPA